MSNRDCSKTTIKISLKQLLGCLDTSSPSAIGFTYFKDTRPESPRFQDVSGRAPTELVPMASLHGWNTETHALHPKNCSLKVSRLIQDMNKCVLKALIFALRPLTPALAECDAKVCPLKRRGCLAQ